MVVSYTFYDLRQKTVLTQGGNEFKLYGSTSNKDSYQHLGNITLPANEIYTFVYTIPVDNSGIDLHLKPIGKRDIPDWNQVAEDCKVKFPAKSMPGV